MKELCQKIYKALYEDGNLSTAALIVGLIVLVLHALALARPATAMEKLKAAPRSQNLGTVMFTLDAVWAWVVANAVDLGDFERMRWLAVFSVPVIYVAMLFWVNDYAGARSVGIFFLLACCPVLDAAWMKADTRWVLNLGVYTWITLGLFWIGMPHTMRDQIAWATRTAVRFKALALAGTGYGLLLLVMALTVWKGR